MPGQGRDKIKLDEVMSHIEKLEVEVQNFFI